jgi:hypothetical protein
MIKSMAALAAKGLRADRRDLAVLALLAGSYAILFTGAALPLLPVYLLGLIGTLAAEFLPPRNLRLIQLIEGAQLGSLTRELARCAAVALFAWRSGFTHLGLIIAGLLIFVLLRAGHLGLRELLLQVRALPVETRNVDLSGLRIPNAPRVSARWSSLPLLLTGTPTVAVVGVMASAVLALLVLPDFGLCLIRSRHLAQRQRVLRSVLDKVLADEPEVVLYHSGPAGTAYQINMWLPVLAELDRRAIVILRQPMHLAELVPTSLPLLCIRSGSDVMDLELPTVKLALYVGNVGDNQHLIRNPDMKHVFVGHGDSDKVASANRVSKIYDEVWVAGPAGRERYQVARVGVSDDAIVEVGRPQLAPVTTTSASTVFTVLYAPTWEGWSDDMFVTSLPGLGVQIVQRLLAASPALRIIYRPHPLTGTRSAATSAAHARIVSLLDAASVPISAEEAAVRARIAALTPHYSAAADGAERARDSAPRPEAIAEIIAAQAYLDELFWARRDPSANVVLAATPSLYSCFNQADMLISDISSVVSDFAASEKPYVVTNLANLSEERFRAENTAARGAYLLGADRVGELDLILSEVRQGGTDPLARSRARSREHLLGPAEPDAVTRFQQAVEAGLQFARNTVAAS